MRRSIILGLLLLLIQSAWANDLTITVVEDNGDPVAALLVRQYSGAAEERLSFMDSGSLTFAEAKCEISTRYTVTPELWSQFEKPSPLEAWKTCTEGPQLIFKFKRKIFRSATSNVLVFYDHGALEGGDLSTQAMLAIANSYWRGDYGGASYLAYEASAALEGSGYVKDASFFRQLAVAATVDGVYASEGHDDASNGIVYDNKQAMFVMTAKGIDELVAWQAATGVKQTGKVDFQTIKGISIDPAEFSTLRQQLLGANCKACVAVPY